MVEKNANSPKKYQFAEKNYFWKKAAFFCYLVFISCGGKFGASMQDIKQAALCVKSPKFDILELGHDKLRFVVFDCDVGFVNSLRRTIIAEVPTMAIDIVTVRENGASSFTHDELLAHRIGLVPLWSEHAHEFKFTKDCDCEETCPKCSVMFSLNTGQTNVTTAELFSADNRVVTTDVFLQQRKQDTFPPALITKLAPGKRLHITAIAKKGIGKENAKWCPVSKAGFQYEPDVR